MPPMYWICALDAMDFHGSTFLVKDVAETIANCDERGKTIKLHRAGYRTTRYL